MSKRGQALLVLFLTAVFCCRAVAPVLPVPKQVDTLAARHPAFYGGFVLGSDFPEDVTQAVFGEIASLARTGALSDVPMFSGLNDRVFYTRFTPGSGRPLVVDGRQVARADSIISSVSLRLAAARSVSEDGAAEIRSWIMLCAATALWLIRANR